MSQIDLHIHSKCSDGSEDVNEIIAKGKKLTYFSITDHDTFEAYERLEVIPDNLVIGIEISAYDKQHQKDVHILGYGFTSTSHVKQVCNPTLEMLEKMAYQQVLKLRKAGYDITWKEVVEKARASTSVYKQHIIDVLKDKGYTDQIYGELYQTLFKNGGICQMEKTFPDMETVIEAIHKDHGYAMIAHPKMSGVDGYLNTYVEQYGIDGVESYHSSQGSEVAKQLHEFVKQHDLLECGGSDYHGTYGNEPDIGVSAAMQESDVETCIKIFMKNQK